LSNFTVRIDFDPATLGEFFLSFKKTETEQGVFHSIITSALHFPESRVFGKFPYRRKRRWQFTYNPVLQALHVVLPFALSTWS
jgi:hypothetical protein